MASSSCIVTTNLRTHLSPLLQSPPYAPSVSLSDVAKPVARSRRLNKISRIAVNYKKFEFKARSSMAEIATEKGKGKAQVFDSEEDLAVSLAKYTADLSDKFVKERGAFTVVLSGGSLFQSLR